MLCSGSGYPVAPGSWRLYGRIRIQRWPGRCCLSGCSEPAGRHARVKPGRHGSMALVVRPAHRRRPYFGSVPGRVTECERSEWTEAAADGRRGCIRRPRRKARSCRAAARDAAAPGTPWRPAWSVCIPYGGHVQTLDRSLHLLVHIVGVAVELDLPKTKSWQQAGSESMPRCRRRAWARGPSGPRQRQDRPQTVEACAAGSARAQPPQVRTHRLRSAPERLAPGEVHGHGHPISVDGGGDVVQPRENLPPRGLPTRMPRSTLSTSLLETRAPGPRGLPSARSVRSALTPDDSAASRPRRGRSGCTRRPAGSQVPGVAPSTPAVRGPEGVRQGARRRRAGAGHRTASPRRGRAGRALLGHLVEPVLLVVTHRVDGSQSP